MKSSNSVIVVKGISASGKSTRVFQLYKFLESLGIPKHDFEYVNSNGEKKTVGILFEEINLLFIGAVYKTGDIERWQGYDAKTSSFVNSQGFSDFIKATLPNHSIVIEGAGVTQSNRLRPKFLHEYCGCRNIFIQYYNYTQDQKDKYLERVMGRSGKYPGETMWDKASSFEKENFMSIQEKADLPVSVNTYVDYKLYDAPIEHFGVEIFKFLGMNEFVPEFTKFVNDFDYISINKFENFTAFRHYMSEDWFKENPELYDDELIEISKELGCKKEDVWVIIYDENTEEVDLILSKMKPITGDIYKFKDCDIYFRYYDGGGVSVMATKSSVVKLKM